MTDYTQTGITGLDEILNGGIITNATVLVSGAPGTGKTILGLQFLYNGAQLFDDRGIYLSFEEDVDDITAAAESIGFDEWNHHVENDDIRVYGKRELLHEGGFSETLDRLTEELLDAGFDRLVLDSLSMFQMFFDREQDKRTYLLKLSDILKESGLTSLLINEQSGVFPETEMGLENFLTDGNIYLIQTPTESGVTRYVWVAKMRKQDIQTDIFPIEIGDGGLVVHENAAGFSMLGESDVW